MSTEEMRAFCQSISPYKLRVQVRLKNGSTIFVGKIESVDVDSFELASDDETREFKYVWIAGIKHHA